ncbi:DEKNAAC102922 [Brettanomyces naardenensis]|uniref:Cysteine proteinase 1, mitochondrial n=1 Tax=Brettanomyces naardenensis TaxID=13370 RepID=A0A448YLY6_BRENA|nr:DEKNAAC102922 [Brettanomyces naardenensis]
MTHSAEKLTLENLAKWSKEYEGDKVGQLAGSVFQHGNIDELLINRKREIADSQIFNTKIDPEGLPVTDQKASGRCWLFASTNLLRLRLMKKYNMKECRLSPSYLFFYDKLEKSNFFLEQIIDTYKEDVNSRIVQWFLTDPISDGGQFTMMTQIVDKYGLVPNDVYPDSFNTTLSRVMDRLLTAKLREFAQILREKLVKGESIVSTKLQMQHDIFRLLCIFLGEPPKPTDEFTWEYYDKDSKFHSIKTTPVKFVSEHIDFQTPQYISLLNDPRNPYRRVVQIERLGNVIGGDTVSYLNMDIDVLAQAVVNRIKNNKAVFFGTDTPKFMDKKRGIMDIDLWDYKLIGYDQRSMDKASRVVYHNSLMTHAMLITAIHLDDEGKPVRYRVENSWSSKSGTDGYYVMTHDYFKEYVYQVVVEKDDIPKYVDLLEDKSPVVLPPYDPMGSLASN